MIKINILKYHISFKFHEVFYLILVYKIILEMHNNTNLIHTNDTEN